MSFHQVIVGNSHELVGKPRRGKQRHAVELYVKEAPHQTGCCAISKVVFHLHKSLRSSRVECTEAPFRVRLVLWGVFNAKAVITLRTPNFGTTTVCYHLISFQKPATEVMVTVDLGKDAITPTPGRKPSIRERKPKSSPPTSSESIPQKPVSIRMSRNRSVPTPKSARVVETPETKPATLQDLLQLMLESSSNIHARTFENCVLRVLQYPDRLVYAIIPRLCIMVYYRMTIIPEDAAKKLASEVVSHIEGLQPRLTVVALSHLRQFSCSKWLEKVDDGLQADTGASQWRLIKYVLKNASHSQDRLNCFMESFAQKFHKSLDFIEFTLICNNIEQIVLNLRARGGVPFPFNPDEEIVELDLSKTKQMNSAAKPWRLAFVLRSGETKFVFTKQDDAYHNDVAGTAIASILSQILCRDYPAYRILPLSGIGCAVEDIGSLLTGEVRLPRLRERTGLHSGGLVKLVARYSRAEKRRFVQSIRIGLILSFLMGLRDRHSDNVMVTGTGVIMHIDFGWALSEHLKLDFGWGEGAAFRRDNQVDTGLEICGLADLQQFYSRVVEDFERLRVKFQLLLRWSMPLVFEEAHMKYINELFDDSHLSFKKVVDQSPSKFAVSFKDAMFRLARGRH